MCDFIYSSLQAIQNSPATKRTEESCLGSDSGLQQTQSADSSNSVSLMSGLGGGKCNDNDDMRDSPALIRKNSVRARANMFQNLQEQQLTPRSSFNRDDLIGSPATRRGECFMVSIYFLFFSHKTLILYNIVFTIILLQFSNSNKR